MNQEIDSNSNGTATTDISKKRAIVGDNQNLDKSVAQQGLEFRNSRKRKSEDNEIPTSSKSK